MTADDFKDLFERYDVNYESSHINIYEEPETLLREQDKIMDDPDNVLLIEFGKMKIIQTKYGAALCYPGIGIIERHGYIWDFSTCKDTDKEKLEDLFEVLGDQFSEPIY